MDQRLDFLKMVAVNAGGIIMTYWGTDVRSRYKDDKSVVTEADLRANEYIVRELTREYPQYGILSEESEDDLGRLDKQYVFIVDPMDGSGDFRRKEEDFSILLSLVDSGTPILGVIYEPLKRRLLFAETGGQAYMTEDGNTVYLPALQRVDWSSAKVGHPKNYKGDKYKTLYEMMGISEDNLVGSGGMGTRMVQLALQETQMILGYTTNLSEWDIAAGQPILEALGYSVTDSEGNPFRYNQEVPKTNNGVLMLHPDIKDEAIEKVRNCFSVLPL